MPPAPLHLRRACEPGRCACSFALPVCLYPVRQQRHPVKSSTYTCNYRGLAPPSPVRVPSRAIPSALRQVYICAATGGGCAASKRACVSCSCTAAITSVETRSNLFAACRRRRTQGACPPPPPRARPAPPHEALQPAIGML
eukprot:4393686-Pleurochrysis_carterae.AAC.2